MPFKSSRYTVKNKIGQGGMGVVYQAIDRLTGQEVALKQVVLPTLQSMFSSQPLATTLQQLRLALAHEFRTLASLRHPHIISVLDYGFDDEQQPYFTMPYLENAYNLLEASLGQSVKQKVRFIQEMLQAVAYLHRRGILHRDLKPENVLVFEGSVRVLDFGLAAAKEEAQESVGTWQYSAPEVLSQQTATEAADLYSVGVLAYQLFADRHPFNVYDPDFLDHVLYKPPDLTLLGVDDILAEVVGKLLAKEPLDRYQTAQEAMDAFSLAIGLPIPAETVLIRESYLQAAQFVGREEELGRLTAVLQQAKAGQGASWLIGGESGVGKTRLLNELQTQALVDGFLVLRGQRVEQGARPYQLWVDALRRLILQQDLDELTASVLQPVVPDIEQLLGRAVAVAPALNENAARQRLFSAVAQLFQQTSQPVLLILEDLQWIQESLTLLNYINRQVNDLSLVIVGSYRDDERPNLPQELPNMQLLSLGRLSGQDMETLSTSMLGDVGQQPEVLDLLQRETEGNAFFLVEVVRALAEEAGRLSAISDISLPEKLFPQGIETIVQRRLAQVPEGARGLLPGTAVLGRYLDLSLLERLAQQQPEMPQLDDWLTMCADAAIFDVENGRWQFAHDKIREAILAQLTKEDRVAWHLQAAESIEAVYPNDPEQAGALAYHWQIVGNQDKERHYAQQAGEYARRQFLNDEAITYLNRALSLTPNENLSERFGLLLTREQIYDLLGERLTQLEDIKTLQSLAEEMAQHGYVDQRAEVALRMTRYAEATADYSTAAASAREALQFAYAAKDIGQAAASQLAWGQVLTRQGDFAEARKNLQSSLAIAESQQLVSVQAEANLFLGIVATELSEYEEAKGYYLKALPLYQQLEDRQGESRVLNNLSIATYSQGDPSEALVYWERAKKVYDEIGDRQGNSRILTNLSSLYLDLGDYEIGKSYSQQALRICREINARPGECFNLINLGLAAHYVNDTVEARRYSNEARQVAAEIGSSLLQGYAFTDSGFILTHQGQLKDAAVFYEQALTLWQALKQTDRLLETKAGLAQVALAQNDLEGAWEHIEPVVEHFMEGQLLEGAGRPFHVYLVAYQILTARHDPRAHELLRQAYQRLQKRASHIRDEARQRSLLEKVPAHQLIIKACESLST